MCIEKYARLIVDNVIPFETLFSIPSLRTLTRSTIREELRRNFQLPYGIHRLPVPFSIKQYLDLVDEEDGNDRSKGDK